MDHLILDFLDSRKKINQKKILIAPGLLVSQ